MTRAMRSARQGGLAIIVSALAGCGVPVGQHAYAEPGDLAAALARGSVFLIDVRTPWEYEQGHIPGAANIPHDQIEKRMDEIPRDKDIVVYCRTGHRVKTAIEVLYAAGYSVYNFGSLGRWEGDLEKGRASRRPEARSMIAPDPSTGAGPDGDRDGRCLRAVFDVGG